MIVLTRLAGSVFALNSDLIERVEATPDTVITLVDGKKYVVSDSLDDVVAAILAYRGAIIAESCRLHVGEGTDDELTEPRRLTAVPLETHRKTRPQHHGEV